MTRVLLLTTEPLPLPGCPTTGAGLRAWGLAQGLRSAGLEVVIGTPIHGDEEVPAPCETAPYVRYFRRNAIGTLLQDTQPEVVVLQHWGLAAELPELSVPLVIDLAGPHLLERLFWGSSNWQSDKEEKLRALRRADFVTCSGNLQRHYFYPFLQSAGYDITRFDVPVIPFSVPPLGDSLPDATENSGDEITFVYGGAFLAWQDPTRAIAWLLQEMDEAGTGRLLFFGGSHPVVDASAGRFAPLIGVLANHPRVEMRGWKPFDELLSIYREEGDVALDLMSRNPERELAFTTRTMIYLHCGLPVIYNNYSELSPIISNARAGWTLDPDDEDAFRTLVRRILRKEEPIDLLARNARELTSNFDWTNTAGPLIAFCKNPQMREGRVEFALAYDRELHDQHAPHARTMNMFHFIREKIRPGRIVAPLVYLASLPAVLYIWLRLRKSLPPS